ncbi:hypothetical protein QBC34DRAFT_459245 [Podospora aff. communis PSN243]|uniref:Rhodanese domain-containing protein n=1 Tax=Podospora aff. communis PSN243 TaxID=3040156 RepID=A0AAV9GSG3_9PEZI|nr:hypothetical protein QBC34DRAFT_459245 [Podospora aff. communis PSN243]
MASQSRRPIDEVAAAESERLASDPNIVSVGIGLKIVGGKATMEAALHYYVRQKLPEADAIRQRGSDPVPPEAGGYKTDVLPMTLARPLECPSQRSPTGQRGSRREAPLVGGTSTSVLGSFHNIATSYGTLGGICFDSGTDAAMAMSNAHVWGTDAGAQVIQPFPSAMDYVGGIVEWLACGGPLSHLLTWTAPSPLTAILTTAAAGGWVAAAASDAEDPTRWGQRTGPVPAPGVTTIRERVQISAPLPRLPFPGRNWSSTAKWSYTRETSAGSSHVETAAPRPNEHVLVGKRVFTQRNVYNAGDPVHICAQIWTPLGQRAADRERFVVAHAFPLSDPSRITQRVLGLTPACEEVDKILDRARRPICVRGFPHQVPSLPVINFPLVAAPFVLIGEDSSVLLDPGPTNPSGVTAVRLPPKRTLAFACPPSTHVQLSVFHRGKPVRATAISANGNAVDSDITPDSSSTLHTLNLAGPEIIRVELDPHGGESYLATICVDKRRLESVEKWKGFSTYYGGGFRLPIKEPDGKWAVVVVSQSLDNTPTGGDPITAARKLGGIVDSANVTETGECACEILYDATFDVETVVLL